MNIRKSFTNVLATLVGLLSITAIAIWQFYLFATYKDAQGLFDAQGGTHHLGWAIGLGLVACILGFAVFSIFLRYDKSNEMHITS